MEKQCFVFRACALWLAGTLLSGCACLQNTADVSRQSINLSERCAKAEVLVTDLSQPATARVYVLPGGQVCSAKE